MKIETCQEFADWTEVAPREEVWSIVSRLAFRALPFLTTQNDTSLSSIIFPASHICLYSYGRSILQLPSLSTDVVWWSCSELMEISSQEEGVCGRAAGVLGFVGHAFLTGDPWENHQAGEPTLSEMACSAMDELFDIYGMSQALIEVTELDINSKLLNLNIDENGRIPPLWQHLSVPKEFEDADLRLSMFLNNEQPHWRLFKNWYESIKVGKNSDIDALDRTLSLSREVWEEGPNKVGVKLIGQPSSINTNPERGYKSNFKPDRIIPESISVRVELILDNPATSHGIASGVASKIQESIENYVFSTTENSIPDEFSPLDRMPTSLIKIAVQSLKKLPDRNQVSTDVTELVEEIIRLEAQLTENKKPLRRKFSESFVESSGRSLGDWKMYAALFAAIGFWTEGGQINETIEKLSRTLGEIFPKDQS